MLTAVAAVVAALVPVHQGLIEAYKGIFKVKLRRYFEALAEILYGPEHSSTAPGGEALGWGERFFSAARLVPERLGAKIRREWVQGAERRLIESFMQRGVGDSPTPDISEQDIENVMRVIREREDEPVREAARRLRLLAARGSASGEDAAEIIESVAKGPVANQLKAWAKELRELDSPGGVGMAVDAFYQAFVERFLPQEHAARIGLPNALKSAELRYHNDVIRLSTILAVIEGVVVAYLVTTKTTEDAILAGVAAGAALFLGSQGSKGLLDALIGLGSRLRLQS